ncbi:MAG TPA: FAD-dependent oxidoreductase, partial [Propionibacteriaceae bacterium]|nr:FAD-dependent oxidoreductase [Propionibacteriaceae bacterium]
MSTDGLASIWLDPPPTIESDRFDSDAHYDVAVVGAGLTGLATALLLARAGRRVVVLEARSVGAVTTGHSTAKVSLLQGTRLSTILSNHTEHVAGAYVEGNREAQAWLLAYASEHGVSMEHRDAYTYAGTQSGASAIRREFDIARRVGLPVEMTDAVELPYPTYAALCLPDQLQVDPMDVLAALARGLRVAGGVLIEGVRVTKVAQDESCELLTAAGNVTADTVVLATGLPFLDRGLYFAKVTAHRSYVLAFRRATQIPHGMYISADQPTRSLRTALHDGEELLLVGGNGHPVGRHPVNPSELVTDLTDWTRRWFQGAERTHVWSAQDYVAHGGVPFVGKLPRGGGHMYLATGYSKWGMTNAVAAAMRISGEILDEVPSWARTLGTRVSKPASAVRYFRANAAIGFAAAQGWLDAELHPLKEEERTPPEGTGVVGAVRGEPVAISTVAGRTCAVSAICTHLGGIVRFNDLEKSWDCPLHGSRFAADGTLLEGPSNSNLKSRPA